MHHFPLPRAPTVEEVGDYAQVYASTARNAVLGAALDGVEIHAANGYFSDLFLQTDSNKCQRRRCEEGWHTAQPMVHIPRCGR
jgi:2,4-dienoyl-CoA reductase-like NADH-dependent reductase (Old Yellow Enzyme family)